MSSLPGEEFCIGIDVGTSALKGLKISTDGGLLAEASASYPVSVGSGGRSEQDPDLWWEAAESVLAQLDSDRALGIGLSGQMHGLVLLDRNLRPVRPAMLWNDARAGAEAAELEARLGGVRLPLELAGTRAMAGLTAPKLLWLGRHEPEAIARARHVLLPKDEVRRRLCGELASDVGDASGTFLFDVPNRRWSPELIAAAEVEEALLPSVGEAPELAGHTPAGVPVALGSGDQPCGAIGVGAVRPEVVSLAIGTSGVAFLTQDEPVSPAPDAWTHSFCHALPHRWYRMGVSLCSGGALRWLADVLAPIPIEVLIEEAAAVEPGEAPSFLPYLSGERTPLGRADARGSFAGLALEHGRAGMVRAVLEGVAFALRDCLDAVLEGVRSGALEIRVSGGAARSDLWMRILASVLERPLLAGESTAGAAYGAAILGGVAGGAWARVEEAPLPVAARTVEPVEGWLEPYRAGLERHRELRDLLVPR